MRLFFFLLVFFSSTQFLSGDTYASIEERIRILEEALINKEPPKEDEELKNRVGKLKNRVGKLKNRWKLKKTVKSSGNNQNNNQTGEDIEIKRVNPIVPEELKGEVPSPRKTIPRSKQIVGEPYIPKSDDAFYILSMDGGGIRGLISASIVREIEIKTGRKVTELFDMVVGTSTGGLLGLFFATGNTADEAIQLYKKLGGKIFKNPFKRVLRTIGGLAGSLYSADPLETELKSVLGDQKLTDLKIPGLFTSYDIKQRDTRLMSSEEAKTAHAFNYKLWEVGRATSAAPIYFKPFPLRLKGAGGMESGEMHLVDGGLSANTPDIFGFIEAKKHWNPRKIVIISIGTGRIEGIKDMNVTGAHSGGVFQMLGVTIEGLFEAQSQLAVHVLKGLTSNEGGSYYRLAPDIEKKDAAMDNVKPKNMANLEKIGQEYTQNNNKFDVVVCNLKKRAIKLYGNFYEENDDIYKQEKCEADKLVTLTSSTRNVPPQFDAPSPPRPRPLPPRKNPTSQYMRGQGN